MNIMNMYEHEFLEHTCLCECVHARIIQRDLTHKHSEHLGTFNIPVWRVCSCYTYEHCEHVWTITFMNIENMYEH